MIVSTEKYLLLFNPSNAIGAIRFIENAKNVSNLQGNCINCSDEGIYSQGKIFDIINIIITVAHIN
jgi:hypothetical protein